MYPSPKDESDKTKRLTRAVKVPGTYYSVYLLLDHDISYIRLNFRQLEEQRVRIKSKGIEGVRAAVQEVLSAKLRVSESILNEIARLLWSDFEKSTTEIMKSASGGASPEILTKITDVDQRLSALEGRITSIEKSLNEIKIYFSDKISHPATSTPSNVTPPTSPRPQTGSRPTTSSRPPITDVKISLPDFTPGKKDSSVRPRIDDINSALEKARIYEINNDHQNAIKILEEIINRDTNDGKVLAYNRLAAISRKTNKTSLAIDYLEKSLRLDPNNADTMTDLALMYKTIGKTAKANELVERLMKIASNVTKNSPDLKKNVDMNTLGEEDQMSLSELIEREIIRDIERNDSPSVPNSNKTPSVEEPVQSSQSKVTTENTTAEKIPPTIENSKPITTVDQPVIDQPTIDQLASDQPTTDQPVTSHEKEEEKVITPQNSTNTDTLTDSAENKPSEPEQAINSINQATAEACLSTANALFQKGDKETAMEFYKQVLTHEPNNEAALMALAEYYEQDDAEALPYYVKLSDIQKENPKLLHKIATIHKRNENFELSVAYLEKALEVDSENPDLWTDLSICYRLVNRPDDATIATKKAMELVLKASQGTLQVTRKSTTNALLRIKATKTETEAETKIETKPEVKSESATEVESPTTPNEPPQESKLTVEEAHGGFFQESPASPEDEWEKNVLSEIEKNNFDAAQSLIDEQVKTKGDSLITLKLQGIVKFHKKEFREAFTILQKAVLKQPNDADLLFWVGRLLRILNEPERAFKLLEKSLELGKDTAEVHTELGLAYHNLKEYDKAVERFKHALLFTPEAHETWALLGAAYQRLGNLDASLRAYNECLRLNPNNTDVINVIKLLSAVTEKVESDDE